ncbi:MAG: ABC-ATPase domain-containing protein [Myxococcota bacterium]|nr:ABC-ATPase domain-containing protein [Myxococcota bacterium]
MADAQTLETILDRIDGRGYKSYSEIRGRFEFERFSLFIDHIQADPFASPSKLRLRIPAREAQLPEALTAPGIRRIALADFLARALQKAIQGGDRKQPGPGTSPRHAPRGARGPGSGKSGRIFIDVGGQEILERSAVKIHPDWVEARIELGLPAAGRRILAREARHVLTHRLPEIVESGLLAENLSIPAMHAFVECAENQESIRSRLAGLGWVAFVADGALLPRASGASELPMASADAVLFRSPESLAVEIEVPNPLVESGQRTLRGMAIRKGITLIVGGGYHGKSTLLRALETSVYPHIPGDGREYVVADRNLVKIRAEDGRSVTGADIHAFIDSLPGNAGDEQVLTRSFSSPDASGSTSQAANIVEALEVGAQGLLLDEDTSATNFMVRDARMQRLVDRAHEPITPFVDRIRELHDRLGISSILVMGGCGDYFEVADTVVMMREYAALDVTAEAHRIAAEDPSGRIKESRSPLEPITPRSPLADSFVAARGRREEKISTRGRELILYGEESLDLRYLSQLVDPSQTRAIAYAIRLASQELMGGANMGLQDSAPCLLEILEALETILDEQGLEALDLRRGRNAPDRHPGNLARPRRYELAFAINRMRSLRVHPAPNGASQ